MRRGTALLLAAVLTLFGALRGLAGQRAADGRPAEVALDVDRPVDRPSDRVVDEPVERPVVREADRPIDERPVDPQPTDVERPNDRETDRIRDREIDRCVDFVTDRRCIDDRHPHVNVRHLIQRLIHAGEWEKLFRLLHRLGIV